MPATVRSGTVVGGGDSWMSGCGYSVGASLTGNPGLASHFVSIKAYDGVLVDGVGDVGTSVASDGVGDVASVTVPVWSATALVPLVTSVTSAV